jgi:hypothetical protein
VNVVPPVVPLIAPLPVPPGLNLTVIDTGVRMPPVQVAATPPVEMVPVAAVPETPPVPPPPVVVPPSVFVPPQRPPRPDRN